MQKYLPTRLLLSAVLVASLLLTSSWQALKKPKNAYKTEQEKFEETPVNLDHLDTTASDPKVRLSNLLRHYFETKKNRNEKISRANLKNLLIEYYFEMEPVAVKNTKLDFLRKKKGMIA